MNPYSSSEGDEILQPESSPWPWHGPDGDLKVHLHPHLFRHT